MRAIEHLAALPGSYLVELNDLGMICVSGEEQSSYLQGQLTLDMNLLNPDQATMGCHCDFKGKTWNIYHCLKGQQHTYLLSHKEAIPASLAELNKYGVFAKVEMADCSASYRFIGAAGAEVESWIANKFGKLPATQQVLRNGSDRVFIQELPAKRYLLLLSPATAADLVSSRQHLLVSPQLWEALDIKAGIANIQAATSNEYVPQMMNMQALNAISFNKGCYVGQEVVARTRYLGKNKRAAYILRADTPCQLSAGDTLELQLGENWRRAGTVIRCATLAAETWLLAVLPNDTETKAIFRAKEAPQQQFEVQPLPYKLNA